jgi:hypothetical protein
MEIKLSDIAAEIGIHGKTLSLYLSGALRSELVSRRLGDYMQLLWEHLKNMTPMRLEAVLYHAYLNVLFPWLQNITNADFDYEILLQECA